jgi:post-segregation antitoxin (ccd killing protein)/DNA-binding transcriptional regulator YdaS (Cro superfamily)
MKDAGLAAAIEAAGGTSVLARRLGITSSAISQWRQVPADRVLAVETATGVPRHRLRPDLQHSANPAQGFAEAQAPFAAEARALGLDPDAISARALQDAVRAEKARRWTEENKEAIKAWNDWVEHNELPLAKYRMF